MVASVMQELRELASVNLFREGRPEAWFVGRPF
jgi:hypothetical protein